MTTLADSFLNDLDELADSSGDEEEEAAQDGRAAMETDGGGDGDGGEDGGQGENGDADGVIDHALKKMQARTAESVATLRKSPRFKDHMEQVRASLQTPSKGPRIGRVEDDPEYQLVVDSNQLIQDLDQELVEVHRFVIDVYSKKFPELESLVPSAEQYMKTVEVIGNEMDMTQVDLDSVLPQTTVMVVSVTGSTTSGQPLSEEDLAECFKGCKEFEALMEAKADIVGFVESRMSAMAPNVCAIVGSRITAQLLGLAGGLTALSQTPACNLQVMGQQKAKSAAMGGFSSTATVRHAGLISLSDLVQSAPPYLRTKALKTTAPKVALAARVDSYGSDTAGETGRGYRAVLEEKIEKWQEPEKAKTKKALPRPDDAPRKKRGGKRVRKFKEKFEMTDVRREASRMGFNSMADEYSDSAMGRDFGMLGKSGSGKVRAPLKKEVKQVGSKKMRVAQGASGGTSGLASSLVFTPVQGLELVNPNADKEKEKVKAANKKWFDANSGFMSAKPT